MEGPAPPSHSCGRSRKDGASARRRRFQSTAGALLYMVQSEKADWKTLVTTLYHQSGLLGVSGVASDMRILRATLAQSQDAVQRKNISEALGLFVYRIVQEIGALTAVMGGLDGIVFTAGIGEHDQNLRADVCQALAWMGVQIDETANAAHAPIISKVGSKIKIRVIPTNEELQIYRSVLPFLDSGK